MDMGKTNKAKTAAVENFLMSLDGLTAQEAYMNLRQDVRDYGWNEATRTAIVKGIRAHFSAPRPAEDEQATVIVDFETMSQLVNGRTE